MHVPEPLLQLKNNGLSAGVLKDTWTFDGWAAKLQRRATLTFALDTPRTSIEILDGFKKAGVAVNTISVVRKKLSTRSWAILFISRRARDLALDRATITVAGCPVYLGDAENRTVIVKIYEAPDEMPHTVIIGSLSAYERIFAFQRDYLASGIWSGVRTAQLRCRTTSLYVCPSPGDSCLSPTRIRPKPAADVGGEGHVARECR